MPGGDVFAIRFDVARIEQILNDVAEDIDKNDVDLLERVGKKLLEFVEEDFDDKKSGSAGANAVQWDPKKRSNGKPIGVNSGRTESRLLVVRKYHAVELVFATQYARHFDKFRELIPEAEKLPLRWLYDMDEEASEAAEEFVDDLLDQEGLA